MEVQSVENEIVKTISEAESIEVVKIFKDMNAHATTHMDNAFMKIYDEYKNTEKPELKKFFSDLEESVENNLDYSEILKKNARYAAIFVSYMNNMFRNKLVDEKMLQLKGLEF